jgi:N-acyl-phosphatidylethanolamine-hydrolysing phospholipase D
VSRPGGRQFRFGTATPVESRVVVTAPAAVPASTAAVSTAPVSTAPPSDVPAAARDLYAPHGDESSGFFNPWGHENRGVLDVLRWKLSRNPYDKSGPLDVPRLEPDGRRLDAASGPALTWIGHVTFAVEDGDRVVVTDPHFGPRALVPRRKVAPGLGLHAVPDDAVALLSHNHYDHLDRWTVERLAPSVEWLVPRGQGDWMRRAGARRVHELDWWQSLEIGAWTFTALPAQHWSNRLFQKRNSALWCSWMLHTGGRSYFFAGDSGYFHGYREIGRRFPGIDVALLPIGSYEPRWFMAYQHMDPAQAYRAFRDLGAAAMVGMHWGTFDLTDEPVDLAPKELAEVLAEATGGAGDPRVRVMAVGERWSIP